MASSPSRYLGAALLQGVGAGAASYGQRGFKEQELGLTGRRLDIEQRTQDQNLLQMLLNRRLMYTQSQQGVPPELEQQINALSSKVAAFATPGSPAAPTPAATGVAGRGAYTGGMGAPQPPSAPMQSTTSTANGPAQFIDGTWLNVMKNNPATRDIVANKSDQEILSLRGDPNLNKIATEYYAQSNAPILRSNNIPVNDDTLRMAHGFGSDAVKVIQSPNATMETLFPPDQQGRMNPVLVANPTYRGKTAGQVSELLLGHPIPQGWGQDTGGFSSNYANYVMGRESGYRPEGGATPKSSAATPQAPTPQATPVASSIPISNNPEIARAMSSAFKNNGVTQEVINDFHSNLGNIGNDLPQQRDPRWLTQEGNRLADQGDVKGANERWKEASSVLKDMYESGRYTDVNGNVKTIPGFFSHAATAARVPENAKFFATLAADQYNRPKNQGVIDKTASILSQFRTGKDAPFRAAIEGTLKTVFPRSPFSGAAADYETIAKEAQNTISGKLSDLGLNSGAGVTDYQRQAAAGATINPTSDPITNKRIMAQMQAGLDYANMYTRDAVAAARRADLNGQVFNRAEFAQSWEAAHPGLFNQLSNEAEKKIAVRGVPLPPNPAPGSWYILEPGLGHRDSNGALLKEPTRAEWAQKPDGTFGWRIPKKSGEQ